MPDVIGKNVGSIQWVGNEPDDMVQLLSIVQTIFLQVGPDLILIPVLVMKHKRRVPLQAGSLFERL